MTSESLRRARARRDELLGRHDALVTALGGILSPEAREIVRDVLWDVNERLGRIHYRIDMLERKEGER